MFPDDETAEKWFVECRWPDGIHCAYCESDNIKYNAKHPTMPYHCNHCKKQFSVKTNSIMHASKDWLSEMGYRNLHDDNWIEGRVQYETSPRLGYHAKISVAHRTRKAWETTNGIFNNEVEADETYMGGKEANKRAKMKLHTGRGTVGKLPLLASRTGKPIR